MKSEKNRGIAVRKNRNAGPVDLDQEVQVVEIESIRNGHHQRKDAVKIGMIKTKA